MSACGDGAVVPGLLPRAARPARRLPAARAAAVLLVLLAVAVVAGSAAGALREGAQVGVAGAPAGEVARASAHPAPGVPDVNPTAGAIHASWDGPAVRLDWQGRTGEAAAQATFVGDRVMVPGDRVTRTLVVTNAGSADGLLSVDLVLRALTTEGTDRALERAVRLEWDVAGVAGGEQFGTLRDGPDTDVAEVHVAKGQSVPVRVGFAVAPDAAPLGSGQGSGRVEFDVVVALHDDTSPATAGGAGAGLLPRTGGRGVQAAVIAVALACLGRVLLASTRRRCDLCGSRDRTQHSGQPTPAADGGRAPALCTGCRSRLAAGLRGVS
ncbi:hypothetical protein ET495_10370 [Xylanimonas allomyrinae]|uniref:Uncharacterized protein n=1 Tax=Xylanimonas allomyrinae TaxID=2509459 RepID=A0A4P6EME2_9MICO|nr:hypothetical protein [Xylanimonas allomyrinae]QAY63585.1 hypothetical protein ET495_10370 [Xylanimonas allomyrinae]